MIQFDLSGITPLCAAFGVSVSKQTAERLQIYGNLLSEYNEKMNLTAIIDPAEIVYKHFLLIQL